MTVLQPNPTALDSVEPYPIHVHPEYIGPIPNPEWVDPGFIGPALSTFRRSEQADWPPHGDYTDNDLAGFHGPIAPAQWDVDEPGPDTPADVEWFLRREVGLAIYEFNEFERFHAAACERRAIQMRAGSKRADARASAQTDAGPEAANDNSAPPGSNPGPKPGRFSLTWFDDISPTIVKRSFIKGVFGEGELSTISGLPGSGKSAITTDAACHVAAGMPWMGRKVRQGLVVFVAAERKTLTERRLLAFRKRYGVERIPLLVLGGRIDLTSANTDARAIVAAVKEAAAACGQDCVWIIVDTLTRTFGPGDQNTSKDMGRYVGHCDLIREGTGAHLTVVHHTGWTGERGKGAIDLDGAVDTSFLVKKAGGSYTLICDGTNDGDDGPVCAFDMESVTVGVDEDGEPTTAPVIVPRTLGNLSGVVQDVPPAKPSGRDIALGHLRNAVEAEGQMPPDLAFSDGAMVVDENDWRERCYADYGDLDSAARRQRFHRYKKALLTAGLIRETGQWVCPV